MIRAFIELATFAWLGYCMLRSLAALARGQRYSAHVLTVVLFVLCGVPLLLDHTFGRPQYDSFPGLVVAMRDDATALLYCAYVAIIPPLWSRYGRPKNEQDAVVHGTSDDVDAFLGKVGPALRGIMLLLLFAPVVVVALAPNPGFYTSYAVAAGETLDAQPLVVREFHAFVSAASLLSVLSAAGIAFVERRVHWAWWLLIVPCIGFDVWVFGKRSIVALAVLSFGVVFWYKGALRGARLWVAGFTGALMLAAFSYNYQSNVRRIGVEQAGTTGVYENVRVDYGRDHTIKLTLYAELNPDRIRILEHRGQSLLFYCTMPVPRKFWPQKPYPYAYYFTSAALLQPPRLWGWGLTTTILEEPIANFGWPGIFVGPLIVALVCRLGDRSTIALTRLVSIAVGCLLLTVELVAFSTLFLLWVILLLWTLRRAPRPQPRPLSADAVSRTAATPA